MHATSTPLAIGIDIGADRLHVAKGVTPPPGAPPFFVVHLDELNWADDLIALVPPGSTVAYEPTGWHYSAPVVAVLHHIGCTVIQVEHRVTGMVRALRISGVKKDITDAQALAYAAAQHHIAPLLGTHLVQSDVDTRVTMLRMLIWSRMRADKERTRAINRLRQLAHSIWPALAQKITTYRRAIEHGIITPAELRTLAADLEAGDTPKGYGNAARRREFLTMVGNLPPWLNADHLRDAIALEARALVEHERHVEEVTALIDGIVTEPPFAWLTDLWLTIPGSSLTRLATIHVATHGAAADLPPEQFRATVGSHPHISQSGEDKESAAARQGFKPAKRDLYLWTMYLIQRGDNPIAATFTAHKERGHKFAVQAARAKLVNILSGIARTATPYDAQKGRPE